MSPDAALAASNSPLFYKVPTISSKRRSFFRKPSHHAKSGLGRQNLVGDFFDCVILAADQQSVDRELHVVGRISNAITMATKWPESVRTSGKLLVWANQTAKAGWSVALERAIKEFNRATHTRKLALRFELTTKESDAQVSANRKSFSPPLMEQRRYPRLSTAGR